MASKSTETPQHMAMKSTRAPHATCFSLVAIPNRLSGAHGFLCQRLQVTLIDGEGGKSHQIRSRTDQHPSQCQSRAGAVVAAGSFRYVLSVVRVYCKLPSARLVAWDGALPVLGIS